MKVFLLISGGGIIGAYMRYYVSMFMHGMTSSPFPHGTFIVNITGCLFIGLVMQMAALAPSFPTDLKVFLITGFAGAYTTFSTFQYETFNLISAGNYLTAFSNLMISNVTGLVSVFAGAGAARVIYGLYHAAK